MLGGYQICSIQWADNFCWISENTNGFAKDDGGAGTGDRQLVDGTAAGTSMVDEHVRQRGGRTNGNRRDWEILDYPSLEEV